jgi:hypothetical protein
MVIAVMGVPMAGARIGLAARADDQGAVQQVGVLARTDGDHDRVLACGRQVLQHRRIDDHVVAVLRPELRGGLERARLDVDLRVMDRLVALIAVDQQRQLGAGQSPDQFEGLGLRFEPRRGACTGGGARGRVEVLAARTVGARRRDGQGRADGEQAHREAGDADGRKVGHGRSPMDC